MPYKSAVLWMAFSEGKLTRCRNYFSVFKLQNLSTGLIEGTIEKELLVVWEICGYCFVSDYTFFFEGTCILSHRVSHSIMIKKKKHGNLLHSVFALTGACNQELRRKLTPAEHPADSFWLPARVYSALSTCPWECEGAGIVLIDLFLLFFMPQLMSCFLFSVWDMF